MSGESVTKHLDEVVDDFARTVPFFYEPLTRGRAITYVEQHRLNTRQRNTVLKLRVATNCPDWEVRTSILKGCTQEAIADSEYGGGKAHWEILIKARAIENSLFVLATNMCGTHHSKRKTYGHSIISDPWGAIIASTKSKPKIMNSILDIDEILPYWY